jgi:hypothetical protein
MPLTVPIRNDTAFRRTEARLVGLTPAELESWKAASAASGQSLSELVRESVAAEIRRRDDDAASSRVPRSHTRPPPSQQTVALRRAWLLALRPCGKRVSSPQLGAGGRGPCARRR